MPYKSDAQRRYFNWAASKGKLSKKMVNHWNKASKGMDLPDRVGEQVELTEAKKKKDPHKGWHGTLRAMLTKHSDKFSKEACKKGKKEDGKLCPYAVVSSMEDKGYESHYKDQKTSLKGKPKKKKKFKNETVYPSFRDYKLFRESTDCQCSCKECKAGQCSKCTCEDCDCDNCSCC